jgi:four helix bundle protein
VGKKGFDSKALLERLKTFGQRCQKLVFVLPKTQFNRDYGDQLIRSSSSPGANYIEALEALGRKDFIFKLRTSRKETRESVYWLEMIKPANAEDKYIEKESNELIGEGTEIVKIFTASIITLEKRNL